MGKDQKLQSDTARGKAHAEGTPVTVVQMLVHTQLGTISYSWPRYWLFHAHAAERAARELAKRQQQLVDFPVHDTIRSIDDMDYIESMYTAGIRMVTELVLALQHLCHEIERTVKVQLHETNLDGRLREALQAATLTPPAERAGYDKYIELRGIRDAIEHPKSDNVYNGKPGQWDRVPLAWFFSDRGLVAFQDAIRFMKSITDDWEERAKQLTERVELTVIRGVYSQRQFKKPRESATGE